MKKTSFIIILLISFYHIGFSAPSIKSLNNLLEPGVKTLTIEGVLSTGSKVDEVTIHLFSYVFNKRNNLDASTFKTSTKNGRFNFTLQAIEKLSYISLTFFSPENKNKNLQLFLIEPGDSINISFTEENIEFTGKGSEKLNLQYLVSKFADIIWDRKETASMDGKHGYHFLNRVKEKYDELFFKKTALLNSYQNAISPDIFERLKVDYKAEELYILFRSFYFWMKYPAEPGEREEQIMFYKEHLLHQNINLGCNSYQASSKYYADFVMLKIIIDLSLANSDINKKPSLQETYIYINTNFTGPLKEKLVTICFIQMFTSDVGQQEYLQKAINDCKDLYLKNILIEIAEAKSKGKPAYNFSLENEWGDLVRLKDFSGKVIVLDFWFSGCPSCRSLETEMKKIRKVFKSDSNVVFLSINVDRDKEKWKANLVKEFYSAQNEINLFTNGLGTDDPLIRYYGFIGFPQIVIINQKQKIVTTNPVLPIDEITREMFIRLIQKEIDLQLIKNKG